MRYSQIRNFVYILSLSVIAFACGDSATDTDSGPAIVEGRVENTGSGSQKTAQTQVVEGAVVTAAQITEDGSLETIGNAQAETDAQGEFTLEIDGDVINSVDAADQIIITAESEGSTASAFVTSEIRSGTTVIVQPIGFESTAEADVYQEVIANEDNEMVTTADIEATVQADVAVDMESNTDAVAEIATALAERAEARAEFYAEEGIEVTEEQRQNITQTEIDAQIELENRLYAATSEEEQAAAFETFLETIANAALEAGIESSAVAKSSDLGGRILLEHSAELSEEAQAEIHRNACYMTAVALDAAVQAHMEAIGASESTIDEAANAGAVLKSEILANADATIEEIDTLFVNYNAEIVAAMESDSSVEGETFVTVNSIIRSEGGAKASFESALEGIVDLGLLVDAYTEFYSDVKSTVDAAFSDAENAEAYAELLVLINIAS